MKKIDNILIVGGGSSACIFALIVKKRFPDISISIVESSKVGIIGVGEGSTEHWKDFCDYCDIDMRDIVRECGATYKLSIRFNNWGSHDFMHSLTSDLNREHLGYFPCFAHIISTDRSVRDFQRKSVWDNQIYRDQEVFPTKQFHFHAIKLNNFLHSLCVKRGIKFYEDDIDAVNFDNFGNILSVKSKKKEYSSDFFVDATGFGRVLMKKNMNVKWISYKKYLPVDSAIAFPTEEDDEYNLWTNITAHDCGWSWSAPVQGRNGNGYVYSSEFTNKEKAQLEMESFYKKPLQIFKEFRFDPGKLEKSWHKNCISIGIASNFIEPLEAPSIGSSILQSFSFVNCLPSYDEKTYNQQMDELFENILTFIACHYRTKREDTDFWKFVKYELEVPDLLSSLLEKWRHRLPQMFDITHSFGLYGAANYIPLLYGLDWFNVDAIKQEYSYFPYKEDVERDILYFKDLDNKIPKITHKEAIKQQLT